MMNDDSNGISDEDKIGDDFDNCGSQRNMISNSNDQQQQSDL